MEMVIRMVTWAEYIRGGDPATYFPNMWRWACKRFQTHTLFRMLVVARGTR